MALGAAAPLSGEHRLQPRHEFGADRGGDNDMPGSPAEKLGQCIKQQPARSPAGRSPVTNFRLIQRQQHPGAGGLLQPP